MSSARALAIRSFRLVLIGSLVAGAGRASADAVAWRTNVDSARVEAADSGKLILLHFYTPSCGPCKVLDREVFSQPQVDAALQRNFIPVKVNADTSPALAGAYRITRVPTDVLLSPQGAPLASLSCPKQPGAYLQQLDNFAEHYAKSAGQQRGTNAQPPVNPAYAGLNLTAGGANPETAPGNVEPAATTNPYGATRPNYMAQATTPAPGNSQPVYQNQLAAAPVAAQQPAAGAAPVVPQSYENPYVGAGQPAAAAAVVAAPTVVDNRYAAQAPAAPAVAAQAAPAQTAPPVTPTTAAVQQPPVAQPVQQASAQTAVQLPAGAAPLGLEGFCPVTLRTAGKWVRGNAAVGMEHRGRTYLFASEAERQQFNADPDAYSPVFSGQDPVLMLERGESVPGTRVFGCVHQQRVYLFSSQATLAKFSEQPEQYAAGVRQAMSRIDASAGGTIRR